MALKVCHSSSRYIPDREHTGLLSYLLINSHSALSYFTLNSSTLNGTNDESQQFFVPLGKRCRLVFRLLEFGVHVSQIVDDMV